jgi:isoquinoline 1-oxidoreductase beta subunit
MTTRREFLKVSAAVGGGLAVGFPTAGAAQGVAPEVNAWVVIQPNDVVIIRYARSEMGQGSMTSAAQLVAEELECDWSKVRVEYVDTNQHVRRKRAWGSMAAVGSRTIRQSQLYLRTAGAAAREMLVAAAARSWDVPAGECNVGNGVISHEPSGRRTGFGRVAAAAAKLEPPKEPKLKEPKDWKIAGKPVARVDIPEIVTGRMRYGIDAQLPGMAYAAIAQCPVFGGKVKSVDAAKIAGRRGVLKVLEMGDYVAVVADNWWRANEALRALPIEWDDAGNGAVSSETIQALLRSRLEARENVALAKREGDVDAALKGAALLLEAEYFTPYLAHATLEPQTCTAVVRDGRVDVWASTQNAEATHAAAAAVAGVPLENVYVHRVQAGGGFGRRGAQDFTRQGVAIAKAMNGMPVKLLWTREEDMQHDNYRPASLVRIGAGLGEAGNPLAWQVRVASPSILASLLKMDLKDGVDPQAVAAFTDQPYAVPSLRVEYAQCDTPVPVGFWRTVGHSQNPFARECFIDEMAYAAGKDPYEYRRSLLPEDSRERRILDITAKAAGWDAALPAGVHRGMAVTEAYGSYTAAVAELSVSDANTVHIRRLVLGLDSGHVVNPDNVEAQLQGSAVFMLTAMFWGEITVKEGRAQQSSFHDYRMMRLAEMPKVELVVSPSGGFWGGVGEPGQAAMAPAVANAIFFATGRRIRSLPLRNLGFELG